jgi:uncharacterized protein YwlG (UPF0340 family)
MYVNIPTFEVGNIIQAVLCKQEINPDILEHIRSSVGICIGQTIFSLIMHSLNKVNKL